MNDGRDLSFGAFLGSLSVGTKLFAAFLIFFLCAVAPVAGTWFVLHHQVPTEQSAPAEKEGAKPETAPAQSFLRIHWEEAAQMKKEAQAASPHAAVRWPLETVTQIWGAGALALVGLGGTLLYLLWKHVVGPLERLKREAISVAGGAPGRHLTVPPREDEIGMLARAVRYLKIQAVPSAREEHTAFQDASGAPAVTPAVRFSRARRVGTSGSVTVTCDDPGDDLGEATGAGVDWTVSTDEVRPLSEYAAGENGGEDEPPSSLPSGSGSGDLKTGVRYDEFMAVVHPGDRDRLRNRQDQAIENGVPIDIEYRIVSPDGREQALRERGVVKMGKDGSPPRFSGHVLDVTDQKANEKELERLRKDYNQLLSSLPNAVLVVEDSSSEIVEANDAAASLFGASVDELLGRDKSFFYPTEASDQFAGLFEAARHDAAAVSERVRRFPDDTPIRIVTDAGKKVPVALSLTSIERADHTFFVVVLADITEQQSAQKRLRAFERAVEQSDDMIAVLDAQGNVQYVNPAAELITGYDGEALVDHPPRSMRLEEIEARNEEKETSQEDAFRDTLVEERKDGSTVVLDQIVTPVHDTTGSLSQYVLTSRNVTKRVEREEELHRRAEALREREARLRGLTNSIPGVVYQSYARPDGSRGLHFVSKHARSVLGLPPDTNVFFDKLIERVSASCRDALKASIDEAVEHREPWSFEFPYEHPSGKRMWLLGSATPDPKDDEVLFNGLLLDITDRKAAERASAEERDRFVTLFESLPTPVLHCELTPNGTLITDVNEAFEDVFGVDATAAEGRHLNDLIVPGNGEEGQRIERRVLDEGTQQFEVRRQTADGMRDFRLQAAGRTSDTDSTELYAIYTDITARKEREERLRERRRKIESLYAGTSHLPAVEYPESVFSRVHEILQEALDYPFIATGFVEDDRIIFENTVTNGESSIPSPSPAPVASDRGVARALRTGETVIVDRAVAPNWESNEVPLDSVANIPVGERGVITIGQTDNTPFNSFDLRLTEILGTYAAVVLDRLDREQELRAAKEEAEDASELKSAMLANISHEIRTPLTAINGFSEVLTEELDPPHVDLAKRVHKGGKRLLNTFDSVLQLSQLEAGTHELDPKRCALDRIVKGTLDEWKERATEQSISLDIHLPDAPVEGMWDADFLGEIVENLLDNAIKFTPSGGKVSIRVRDNDGHAVLEVEDTGIGIGEQFRQEMFQAFKQESVGLTREYEGAGVGLTVTEKAVDRMDGCIEVASEKGEGSRFTVRLPKDQQ